MVLHIIIYILISPLIRIIRPYTISLAALFRTLRIFRKFAKNARVLALVQDFWCRPLCALLTAFALLVPAISF